MCRLITENLEVVYGRNVLTERVQTEVAYLNATEQILVPAGVCNRWTNFTAHPSQTPGDDAQSKAFPLGVSCRCNTPAFWRVPPCSGYWTKLGASMHRASSDGYTGLGSGDNTGLVGRHHK